MTPRELVRRTLEFDSPQRVPRQAWILPWAEERYPEWLGANPDNVLQVFRTFAELDGEGR